MRCAWVRLLVLPLAAIASACGDDGATNMNNGTSDLAMPQAPPDMAKAPKPDMANLSMGPVGGTCMSEADCGGNRPKCLSEITGFQYAGQMLVLTAPDGYCTDEKCKSDDDCGPGGYCFGGGVDLCLGTCEKAGDCAKLNPKNVCINVQGAQPTCFPQFIPDVCNPTKVDACGDGKGCIRHPLAAIDDFGTCVDTCKLGGTCPLGQGGVAQACYFVNTGFDGMGKATKDAFAGLICLPDNSKGAGAPDSACMAINACQPGYECNLYSAGGVGQVCRKLCTNGGNECVLGTCQNAFKLAKFDMGDIGLCL